MRSSATVSFETFRRHLDDYHDTRERLVKVNRDVVNLSKKAIFLLHRLVLDDNVNPEEAGKQGRRFLSQVVEVFRKMKDDLNGDAFWRYHPQVSPGLQEYIEALSFAHLLEHKSIISHAEAQGTICGSDGIVLFPLPVSDFLLGLADLTGELMRYAISGITKSGGQTNVITVLNTVRQCQADLDQFIPYIPELQKKAAVTAQSVQKIEQAAYTIVIRGAEYDLPPNALNAIAGRMLLTDSSLRPDSTLP